MMQVEVQQLEPCKVALNIQVPPEQISKTADAVFDRFAKQATVPGFRRGKAPRKLAERYIDVGAVREAAMDKVIQDAYREALEETGIEPYDQASVELKEFEEGEPLSFTATVPTRPQIELGDYKGIEVRRVVVPIADEDVSRELQRLREQSARYEAMEEPAAGRDRVQCSIQITVDGEPVPEASHENAWLLVGTNFPEIRPEPDADQAGRVARVRLHLPRGPGRTGAWPASRLTPRCRWSGSSAGIVPEEDDEFAEEHRLRDAGGAAGRVSASSSKRRRSGRRTISWSETSWRRW